MPRSKGPMHEAPVRRRRTRPSICYKVRAPSGSNSAGRVSASQARPWVGGLGLRFTENPRSGRPFAQVCTAPGCTASRSPSRHLWAPRSAPSPSPGVCTGSRPSPAQRGSTSDYRAEHAVRAHRRLPRQASGGSQRKRQHQADAYPQGQSPKPLPKAWGRDQAR
jgi:hypothetical protein